VFLLVGAVMLAAFAYFFLHALLGQREMAAPVVLETFRSDFQKQDDRSRLYADAILKEETFIAFGGYVSLKPGKYEVRFSLNSPVQEGIKLDLQIAAARGKEVAAVRSVSAHTFPAQYTLAFDILTDTEIEPRVRLVAGPPQVKLERVEIVQTGGVPAWPDILCRTMFWGMAIALVLWIIWLSLAGSVQYRAALALFFLLIGFYLILRHAWVSEDAFITMRHVEHFISGYGPVFNVGERVEGYTHALWFYIVSLLRFLGLSAKGAVILPGLLFSLAALYLLFFRIRFSPRTAQPPPLNLAAAALIGTSAFIDFGTSGLETSLSYLLLVIYGLMIASGRWMRQPLPMGLLLVALTFTRPDFGIFLVLIFVLYMIKLLKKQIGLKDFLLFLACPLFLLGGYQIFRMGYYAALFPNPVLTKSAFGTYFAQGLKYLLDFSLGSAFILAVLIAIAGAVVCLGDKSSKRRLLVLGSGLLHGFFVVRGGGDFMHGRFLLPAFILIVISAAGAFDGFLEKKRWAAVTAIFTALLLLVVSLLWTPLQKRGKPYHFGISDERFAYYQDEAVPVKYLFRDTVILIWKNIGLNYRGLTEKTKAKITIAYKNVGFTGFYAGPRVYLIDRLGLTDPVVARIGLPGRRRPGHEKSAPLGYLMLKRPTFADTPFPRWNKVAQTPFGVLWDLSPRTRRRLRFALPGDFKEHVDRQITDYLQKTISPERDTAEADFLFFLERFWYPYARAAHREIFERTVDRRRIHHDSPAYRWIQQNRPKVAALQRHITGKLDFKQFIRNLGFSFISTFKMRFLY
jgi:arabinofuranosyltransferase